ncbi:MAG: hypothetical protein J6W58_06875 [Lachnospiraceae bacterium]|nr:hypothetical protein [Lachnospiraceae bacterium]
MLMMSLAFCACAGKETKEELVEEEEEKPKKEKKKNKEELVTPEVKEQKDKTDQSDKNNEAYNEFVYKQFLEGRIPVRVKNEEYLDDGVYFLEELIDTYAIRLGQEMLPSVISEAGYSYIDCGMDGNKELALRFYYTDTNEYGSPYTQYLILKHSDKDGLKLCASAHTYYRSEATVNEYGYITEGGSSGAASAYFRNSFVDADGIEQWIYSDSYLMGLEKPMIPPDNLSGPLSNKIPTSYDYEPGYYYLNCYLLEDYQLPDYDPETWDSDYEGLVKARLYVFEDDNGKVVLPDKDYVSICAQNGVRILSKEEFDSTLDEHYRAIGYKEEIQNGKDIEWTSFDVKDNASINAQINRFIENADMWYLDPSKTESCSEVSYCMADLNRNGRYELIRSERLSKNTDNTQFCRNRFFEINEDFSSVYKMDYEVENMWANGELSGWSHDLLRAQQGELNCYWNPDFGSAIPDLGISYFYVTPTMRVNGYGMSECKLVLKTDSGHKIGYSTAIGMADLTYEQYTDEGGFECSRQDYEDAAEISFPSDYWTHDKVYILYVTLDDKSADRLKEALTESASAYFYSTQYD